VLVEWELSIAVVDELQSFLSPLAESYMSLLIPVIEKQVQTTT
jgi:hypothetical protein